MDPEVDKTEELPVTDAFDLEALKLTDDERRLLIDADEAELTRHLQEGTDEDRARLYDVISKIEQGTESPPESVEAPAASPPPLAEPELAASPEAQALPPAQDTYQQLIALQQQQQAQNHAHQQQIQELIGAVQGGRAQPEPALPDPHEDLDGYVNGLLTRQQRAYQQELDVLRDEHSTTRDALSRLMTNYRTQVSQFQAQQRFPDYSEAIQPVLSAYQEHDDLRSAMEVVNDNAYWSYVLGLGLSELQQRTAGGNGMPSPAQPAAPAVPQPADPDAAVRDALESVGRIRPRLASTGGNAIGGEKTEDDLMALDQLELVELMKSKSPAERRKWLLAAESME